ncbi:adenylate kinase isoenzyme 5 isoform X1 [Tribolium castaneum]|uniref:adenylate kinase isoenzyme 5 isoform X1 n=1 Tax=Tribolium castaneum TaxID=7070 RepID=UPI00077DE9CB|nr:PREDICTED: adenylate kinase isoenzyme 5 isoform X1 [Tribolium castaneum]|eukprot:XP_015835599.1 PREDICTED: adenylate kinase isoenzyme 5 isoform X1 [Tribolium castaneum]
MGICLDTEQSDGSQAFEEGQDTWVQNTPRRAEPGSTTPPTGKLPMQNDTDVQFESPKVPVIFVLGGPGSGKVTHCDSLMQEKKGITHINMTDLLQQYAIGNDGQTSLINIGSVPTDMQDFGLLSSKTVTEVLMLEMKMAPTAKTYLVSGFPRNMRDVVEYSEKIQMLSGAIMISWRQKVLERQIDYGAKLGQVVLSLARMELNNFYKNVMPVADYFDQSNMLISINGERHPSNVYKDFRAAVFKILGMQDNPPVFTNGKVATVPSDVTTELPTMQALPPAHVQNHEPERPKTQVISVTTNNQHNYQSPVKAGWPPVLWVIGGPGSNKAALCSQAAKDTRWTHISLGKLLRAAAEPPDPRHNSETAKIRESISAGELVPLNVVMKFVESHMAANMAAPGIILDGFPRDMTQATEFEAKFKQKPSIVLLDCSKLQLGRGRLDDSVTAFRRRLEIFRQSSLPMLKTMDNIGRLTIVDGDTDTAPVQDDFKGVVKEHIEYIKRQQQEPAAANGFANGHVPNGEATLQDLEAEPIETISKHVGNGVAHSLANGVRTMANGYTNGHIPNGYARDLPQYTSFDGPDNRQMYNEVNYMDGHI